MYCGLSVQTWIAKRESTDPARLGLAKTVNPDFLRRHPITTHVDVIEFANELIARLIFPTLAPRGREKLCTAYSMRGYAR